MRAVLFQLVCAGVERCSRSIYIIDEQDALVLYYYPIDRENAFDIPFPLICRHADLRAGVAGASQAVEAKRDVQALAECLREQGSLIVGASPETPAVHGDRQDEVDPVTHICCCTCEPWCQRGEKLGLVFVFKAGDELATGRVVDQGGARHGERWLFGEAMSAEAGLFFVLRGEGVATTGAIWGGNEVEALPARAAQSPLLVDNCTTHAASWRQKKVDDGFNRAGEKVRAVHGFFWSKTGAKTRMIIGRGASFLRLIRLLVVDDVGFGRDG